MASHEGGGSPPGPAVDVEQDVPNGLNGLGDNESESGSSYAGTASGHGSPICPFRNSQFHNQECSLFFDCPSHSIKRTPADYDEPNGERLEQPLAANDPPTVSSSQVDEGILDAVPLRDGYAMDQAASELAATDTDHAHEPVDIDASGLRETPREQSDPTVDIAATLSAIAIGERNTQNATEARNEPILDSTVDHPLDHTAGSATTPRPLSSSSQSSRRPETPAAQPAHATQPQSLIATIAPRQAESRSGTELVLPPWQLDSDVSSCPICHTEFRFYNRKHHCRKCGRVVCNSCSPHRITIPNQYIVRAPGELATMAALAMYGGERGIADFNISLGGGERVRLCNPCVPDPNTTPPQPQLSPRDAPYYQAPRSGHQRSQSSVGGSGYFYRGASGLQSPPFPTSSRPVGGTSSRSRSATLVSRCAFYITNKGLLTRYQNQIPSQLTLERTADASRVRSGLNAFPFGGSPRSPLTAYATPEDSRVAQARQQFLASYYYPGASSSSASRSPFGAQRGAASSSRSPGNSVRPLPLPPQIPEEDQCPICHHELPSRLLPDFETLREEHITACIADHTAYKPSIPTTGQAGIAGTSPQRTLRRTGLISYIATEKDCANNEECAICFEEFEPGIKMARLECWCRFHYECISEWFGRRDGRCPVHQHDSFGY